MAGSSVQSVAITNGVVVNTDDTIGQIVFMGWSIRETAGAVGVIRIRQGTVTGLILATLGFVALESKDINFGEYGLECRGDLYCQIVSGTFEGSLRYA